MSPPPPRRPRPAPRQAPTDAQLIALLLDAYRRGLFPMADPGPDIDDARPRRVAFYAADPRGVLPLATSQGLHVPRSLEKTLRSGRFAFTTDRAFDAVVRACAAPRPPGAAHPGPLDHAGVPRDDRPDLDADEPSTWIDATILRWYTLLHRAGHAHSLEAWRTDPISGQPVLVGGVYGVAIGAAFFGESMFCRPRPRRPDGARDPLDGTDASKASLLMLVRHLDALGFVLFDTQMVTPSVARLGALEIPQTEYLRRLHLAASGPDRWRPLAPVHYHPRP